MGKKDKKKKGLGKAKTEAKAAKKADKASKRARAADGEVRDQLFHSLFLIFKLITI